MKKESVWIERVIADVRDERVRQDNMWSEQNHTPFEYLAILGEEVGEANRGAMKAYDWKLKNWPSLKDLENYREELVQVAAVAVAAIECLDRAKWRNYEQG